MLRYPIDAPVDAIQSLVTIVKSQSFAANKAEFGLAVWNVQGYVQDKILGGGPLVAGCGPPITTHEEAVAACTALESQLDVAEGAQAAIPWTTLLPILKYALTTLLTIL